MTRDSEARIHLTPGTARVRARANGHTIADTTAALALHEKGYPVRQYIPIGDVSTGVLQPSDKRTHCPYKGDTRYFDVVDGQTTLTDAAWTYPEPIASMAAIAGHVAFDHPRITLDTDER